LGVDLEPDSQFEKRLKEARQWNDEELPQGIRRRVLSDYRVLQAVQREIRELVKAQKAEIRDDSAPAAETMRKLLSLRAVGLRSSSVYAKEFFAWRKFRNRRQVGSLAGLCPTPYSSGKMQHEHGISKAGNRWIRAIAVELALSWVRYQPKSALTTWYQKRALRAGRRAHKTLIVALARKLLVELWKYLETGNPPQGAILLDWRAKVAGKYVVVSE